MAELDPHWDWAPVYTFGDPEPRYVRGYCEHVELVRTVTLSEWIKWPDEMPPSQANPVGIA
jgi:hypothetical protein